MGGFTYKPEGEVLRQFLRSNKFFRGIRGPVGSGKSVANCIELWRRAGEQKPSPIDGIRKTRWAVVRNTNPQLRTTTIKTWLAWFNEKDFGRFNWSVPYTHHIVIGDIDCEVIFIALDRPEDVRKLLSLDLTGVFLNEAREIPKQIVDACTMRVGRYPDMLNGGPTWYGVIADTNAPEDDHWWPVMAGESPVPDFLPEEERLMLIKPDDWEFFTQPSGMTEEVDEHGRITAYAPNPLAENVRNLPPEYYPRIITGKAKTWIDVYVMNRLGNTEDGKPVYPSFRTEVHVAKQPLDAIPDQPVYIGIDFGLTPAAVIAQRLPTGGWQILHEVVTSNMGIRRFADLLNSELMKLIPFYATYYIYGDPSGDFRSPNDESTAFQMLRQAGIDALPAPSNDPVLRIETVEKQLNSLFDGRPGLLISPTCKMIIKGFAGGYQYRRVQVSGEARYEEKPNKNKYSHIHDALQYLFLGAGEGRELIRGKTQAKVANVRGRSNLWDRVRSPRRQKNRMRRGL